MLGFRIIVFLSLVTYSFSMSFSSSAHARKSAIAQQSVSQNARNASDQIRNTEKYFYRRAYGTRIDRSKINRCNRACQEKVELAKISYLERALSADELASVDYQKELEAVLFSDQKFVSKCWKGAVNKGIDFFFTVAETGKATDIAWFPKASSAKCIKRRVKAMEFPQPGKPHHAWLLVTGL